MFHEKKKIHNRSKQRQTWGKKEDYSLKMKAALAKKLAKRTLKKEWFEKEKSAIATLTKYFAIRHILT